MQRKLTTIAATLFLAILGFFFWQSGQASWTRPKAWQPVNWSSRRGDVKNAFKESWTAYASHAWGNDRYHPLSKTGSNMSPKGLGWIIVDSLDTLMIMNLTQELAEARRWVSRKLDYDQEQDVNTFETTIRMLGGLLSAHYLSSQWPDVASARDRVYLSKAVDLADRLLGAYESPSGLPYASIWLNSGKGIRSHTDGGASSTAEATTVQLEMKYLSNLTRNDVYWRKAEKAMKVTDDHRLGTGLVPIFVDPESGMYTSQEIRVGSRGDSYYEYLIKQYLQTSGQEPIYLQMWEEALEGIENYMVIPTKNAKLAIVAELPQGVGGRLSPKMDHLVCFLPGAIALGATEGLSESDARKLPTWTAKRSSDMKLARELMKTCWGMYAVTDTGVAPEIVWFEAEDEWLQPKTGARALPKSKDDREKWKADYNIRPLDAHNLQRPETVESLFIMWRITQDVRYREWGWQIFQAWRKHSLLPDGGGYTSLHDVIKVPPDRRDNMESFWLAETLKYLYLLFSPNDLLPLTEVVFNTEAHVFPKIRSETMKTGWQRSPRQS